MKNLMMLVKNITGSKTEPLVNPVAVPMIGERITIGSISGRVMKKRHVFTDAATSKIDQTVYVYVDEYN